MRLKVYEKLLSEDMAPKLYDLTTAGSSYAVALGSGGLTLDFVSYREALPTLIAKVLGSFNGFNKELKTQAKRFERVVSTYKEDRRRFWTKSKVQSFFLSWI